MIGPVLKTDAAVASAGQRAFRALPPGVQLGLLAVAVVVGMGGCAAAWIDQQDYVPSPNICAPSQVTRTDCEHVQRVTPTGPAGQR